MAKAGEVRYKLKPHGSPAEICAKLGNVARKHHEKEHPQVEQLFQVGELFVEDFDLTIVRELLHDLMSEGVRAHETGLPVFEVDAKMVTPEGREPMGVCYLAVTGVKFIITISFNGDVSAAISGPEATVKALLQDDDDWELPV